MSDEQKRQCDKKIFCEEIAKMDYDERMRLPLFLGYDVNGEPLVIDLAQAPHILIAGAPGQGISTIQKVMIDSLLSSNHQEDIKLYLADCRMIEFAEYGRLDNRCFFGKGISDDIMEVCEHLSMLGSEIDSRYAKLRSSKCKSVDEYRKEHNDMPYIVAVINEYSDYSYNDDKHQFLNSLIKIAQIGRSVGVHCIISTQKPNVDVISGMIKANFPTRIAARCATKLDSVLILDCNGAERLSGKGDMILTYNSELTRFQGLYQDQSGTDKIIDSINERYDSPLPISEKEEPVMQNCRTSKLDEDALMAARLIVEKRVAATSFLQRTFGWGFNKASRIMDELLSEGIVGPMESNGERQIIVDNLNDLEALLSK